MERTDILAKLRDIYVMAVPDAKIDPEDITEDMNLLTDLGMSSINLLYMVIAMEEFFDIRFDDVSFGDFNNVGEVIDYIQKKKA
ncbi:MAG: acyl carrier protein [Saccharofermentans sp.]|nr:acyl carrier protein [Saccharofermentans sp.]